MSHTIEAAMKRGELTEEEAFFVLRFAGRHGYKKAMTRLSFESRLLKSFRWIINPMGWHHPELSQWDRGAKKWELLKRDWKGRLRICDPTPVSILGHRATFFGNWSQIKIRKNRCYVTIHHDFKRRIFYMYWSADGTPPRKDRPHEPGRFFFGTSKG